MYRTPLAVLLVAIVAGCLQSTSPTDTEDPGAGSSQTGSLTVSAITSGADLDADGYTAIVEGTSQALGVNGSVTFAGLPAGPVSVSLSGVADNCDARELSPLTVPVVGGETTAQTFNLTCEGLAQADYTLVASDRTGNIWILDENTGAETSINHTPMSETDSGPVTLGVISSMAWIPSTDSWWMGMGGNSVCENRACVYVRDNVQASPSFGFYAPLVDNLPTYAVPGLAVRPLDGSIYTFAADGSDGLVELNPVTGALTTVFDTFDEGNSGKGTTFGPDGLLYVWGDEELFVIDVDLQTFNTIGTYTFTGFPTILDTSPTVVSMTTRESDGTVFAIFKDGGGAGQAIKTTYLVTVNLATAELTNVGAQTNLLDGLAYIPTSLVQALQN